MSVWTRVVNFLAMCLVGEPLLQFPSENWELSKPRLKSEIGSSTLTFQVRDARYPRLRGTMLIELTSARPIIEWRTRASAGKYAANRLVSVTDDGYLAGCHLSCTDEELKIVRTFLQRQIRPGRDEEDPLLVAVPPGPNRPRGGLANAASSEE